MSNVERGLFAIREFHNYALIRYPAKYTHSYESLRLYLEGRNKFSTAQLGAEITAMGATDSQVTQGMKNLVEWWSGKVIAEPVRFRTEIAKVVGYSASDAFWASLSDKLDNFGEVMSVGYSATMSGAKTIAKDTVEVVATPIDTAFSKIGYIPVIAICLIGGVIYFAGKSGALKITKVM
jgi:hypothetical protein